MTLPQVSEPIDPTGHSASLWAGPGGYQPRLDAPAVLHHASIAKCSVRSTNRRMTLFSSNSAKLIAWTASKSLM